MEAALGAWMGVVETTVQQAVHRATSVLGHVDNIPSPLPTATSRSGFLIWGWLSSSQWSKGLCQL